MSMISEQVKHLKELSNTARANMYSFEALSQSLREAADTIEALFAKLAEYEDLGPTPDQLRQIDDMYAERCKEISDLRKQLAGQKKGTRENTGVEPGSPPGWKQHITGRFTKVY